jgi:hypothetical protein
MSNIKALPAVSPLPPDLPERLRELADHVESGRVTAMVIAFARDGEYQFIWPSTRADSVVLAGLAHHQSIERMRCYV